MSPFKYTIFMLFLLFIFIFSAQGASAFSLMEKVHPDCLASGDCNVCDATRIVFNAGRFIFISMASVALMLAIWGALNLILAFIDWSRLQVIKSIFTHTLAGLGIIMLAWMVVYMIMFTVLKTREDPEIYTAGVWYTGPACQRVIGDIITPVQPDPEPIPTGCAGIQTTMMERCGMNPNQCNDASPALSKLLECVKNNKNKYTALIDNNLVITSISDNFGFLNCRDRYVRNTAICTAANPVPPNGCSHSINSCHYGGRGKAPYSFAADIRNWGFTRDDFTYFEYLVTVDCGGQYHPESTHIHISVEDCGGL